MEEKWVRINDFDNYEISNYGRLKSYAKSKDGKITTGVKDKKGYLVVRLYNNNYKKGKDFKVHRLVAMAFLDNPDNLPEVNHKDEDKTNNCVDNLEWCDTKYNVNYGTRTERAAESNRCCVTTSKKIYSDDCHGHIISYDSIGEAERVTGLSHANIVRTLKGRTKTCGGYRWYYENSQITNND